MHRYFVCFSTCMHAETVDRFLRSASTCAIMTTLCGTSYVFPFALFYVHAEVTRGVLLGALLVAKHLLQAAYAGAGCRELLMPTLQVY